jgi:predicted XRE-type DNA-binding protein
MNEDKIEIIRGSGNVFRDTNMENADLLQLRSLLAAQIIKILDELNLTGKQAQTITGIAEADFSRIRRVKLDRFTIDRLMTVLNRLNQRVEINIKVRPYNRTNPADIMHGSYPSA